MSVSPGTCAGSVQAPRTMRSIFTPFCPARMSAPMISSSVNAFILATMRVGSPLAAACPSASMRATRFLCRSKGASHMRLSLGRRLWLAMCTNTASMSAVSAGSAVRWLMSVYRRAVRGL
ncbi:hypothetical protein D9M69_571740 [compost metagenome]